MKCKVISYKNGKKLIELAFPKDKKKINYIISVKKKKNIFPHFFSEWEDTWYLFPGRYIWITHYWTRKHDYIEIYLLKLFEDKIIKETLGLYNSLYSLNCKYFNQPLSEKWKWLVDVVEDAEYCNF